MSWNPFSTFLVKPEANEPAEVGAASRGDSDTEQEKVDMAEICQQALSRTPSSAPALPEHMPSLVQPELPPRKEPVVHPQALHEIPKVGEYETKMLSGAIRRDN
jgi:hypothetical protein